MENLPDQKPPEIEIIEPEIVGREPKPSSWQKFKTRAAFGLILATIGFFFCVLGALLTLSIIGAPLGIPMIILGALIILLAISTIFGRGQIKITNFHQFK